MDKVKEYSSLVVEASSCRLCSHAFFGKTYLSSLNGPLDAEVMFIGEAPGVEVNTGPSKPMDGTKSGANFDHFLRSTGFDRGSVYVTNVLLHSPITDQNHPRSPVSKEIGNCLHYLKRQIEIVNPKIVATLGNIALKSTSMIEFHSLRLSSDVGAKIEWFGRYLVPLYHPSPQVITSHRNVEQQISDYKVLRCHLHHL